MNNVLLSARDLWKIYGSGELQVFALREVNLDIEQSELLMIVGASGSGKSTLLNTIGGIDRPTRGQLLFEGQDLSQANDHQLTPESGLQDGDEVQTE